MSQRFPPLASSEATALDDELDARMNSGFGSRSKRFEYKDESGAPLGPFAVLA